MPTPNTQIPTEGHLWTLRASKLEAMSAELHSWREDPGIGQMEEAERILAFVRGLRVSALLIYWLRELLPGGLEAHWGHILDQSNGVHCSPECDVIIHYPGNYSKWNGHGEKSIMDFHFIPADQAVAVISCKSDARQVDATFPKKCESYVSRIGLFAECCQERAAERLSESARQAGYAGFWYLYNYDDGGIFSKNRPDVWSELIDYVCQLPAERTGAGGS